MCSFAVLSTLPEDSSRDRRNSVSTANSPARDIAPLGGGSSKTNSTKQPRGARSPQHTPASSIQVAKQESAAASSSRTLEEMKKRTQRLELMMEVMMEDSLHAGNMSSISSKARQRLEQHGALLDNSGKSSSVEAELAKAVPDTNYASSTGFLPLTKLLEPEMVAWANPLEALGLEEQWDRICNLFKQEFSRILPLSHLRHPDFFNNQCPFLQTSILLFTSRTTAGQTLFTNIQRRSISTIAERNISTVTRVKPTDHRIIATLIMSNLPPNLPSDRLQFAEYQTTPLMALSMAQHVELDAALYLPHDGPFTGWAVADMETILEKLCLEQSALLAIVPNGASKRLPATPSSTPPASCGLQFAVDFSMVE
ncbi:hypothetical protein QFC22_004318 [Naganishia vaughanmartiniae]|uniref:Uncharacterized protein n=1 Tax=Naganishia vaughanmartiniae TaxID=1424756 RepID=A0ACC2X173_9TREE|nr:hypothetical protein QFC22_004318 [Naganishia vaughanmartiniae]